MYGLPSTVGMDRRLPKETFYRRASLSAPVKDEFVHGIEGLRVVASIKEATCGIPAAGGVDEILVLRVELRVPSLPERALTAMQDAVPRPLLLACCHGGDVRTAVVRRGAGLRISASWKPEDALKLTLAGATLARVWDSLCAQVIFGDANGVGIDARIARDKRIAELEAYAAQLERKHGREGQVAKRNALFHELRATRAELSRLKGEQ